MRKKLQRSDYERLIAEYETKGKAEGQQAFARRHGISVSALQHWLYRLRREKRARQRRNSPVEFVEVKPARVREHRAERVEIELPVGVVIRLANVSGAEIADVVSQVSRVVTQC